MSAIIIIAGEFGVVYWAKLDRVEVAVKSLKQCESEKEKRNFEREMTISADPQMKHLNIVRVYGLVREGINVTAHSMQITIKSVLGPIVLHCLLNTSQSYILSTILYMS